MALQKPRTIFLLRLLQLNIYNLLVEQLSEFALTPLQYMVLSIVGNHDRWSTADLARRFHIAPQSMNEVVSLLRRKRLIERRQSSEHRRILHLRLTASGARLLGKCDKAVDQIERTAFKEFALEEIDLFRGFISRALAKFAPGEQRSSQRILVSASGSVDR